VNPAEFVKLHDNLPGYLKPIIEFLYFTGMRSGASKKLEHKHVDLEAQVIRLPIELSKNKKGLTIPLSGRLLVLVESAWNNRSLDCPYLFHHKAEPIGDFRKAFDAACAAASSASSVRQVKHLIHDNVQILVLSRNSVEIYLGLETSASIWTLILDSRIQLTSREQTRTKH
jgi:integrase